MLGLAVVALTASGASADVVLDCNFNNETLGNPVPTGDASRGWPVSDGGTGAIIAMSPLLTPAVKVTDSWADQEGLVQFEFIGSAEATMGQVTITMTLCFIGQDDYAVCISEQGGRASNYADFYFTQDGNVHYADADSPETLVGTYTSTDPQYLTFVFDLDAGTYSVSLNSGGLIADETHGVTSGRGIGGIYIGVRDDVDTDGRIFIDDVHVETTQPLPVELTTWTNVKNLFD
jgi:hypothetical protein